MGIHRGHLCLVLTSVALAPLGCGSGAESPQMATAGATTGPGLGGSTTDDETTEGEPTACTPGTQITCMCLGADPGFQVCNQEGSGFGDCMCEPDTTTGPDTGDADTSGGESSTGDGDPCGDRVCDADAGEDCTSCEEDCGVCEPCDAAPSCEGADIPPIIETHAEFLDDPMAYVPPRQIEEQLRTSVERGGLEARLIAAALASATAGEPAVVTRLRDAFEAHPQASTKIRTAFAQAGMVDPAAYLAARGVLTQAELMQSASMDGFVAQNDPSFAPCDDPRLRIRVARLTVHEEDDDFLNDEVYCAITSEAAEHAELKVTPLTPPLDQGDSIDYSLEGGLIWGQGGLTAPMGNILINYNCIESEGSGEGYANLLSAIGDAVGEFDGKEVGQDGWVFPTAGVVTNLLAGALTLDGDDLLFNGAQTIPAAQMLPLTFGAWWSVRRSGTNLNSDWDWELRMEIWGCHDYGTGMPPG